MANELAAKTIEELAPLLRDRVVSPCEVTEAVLAQIDTYNESLNAYLEVYHEEARVTAKLAEEEIMKGNYKGNLHGIPMGIKDNIYFKDKTTTMGSKIHQDFVSDYDATVVKKLRDAGAIFTGKLNMHEYALGATTENPFFGNCHNPWDRERIPGGSSGGAGSAIASDMAVGTLGSDTSGSIRIPAAACGIIGLKPTFGRVSKYGCFPEAWTLDTIGPMTKTVYDAAAILEVISGFDQNDPTSVDEPSAPFTQLFTENIKDMVIGINEEFYFNNIDSQIETQVREGIRVLKDLGAKIVPIEIPTLQFAEFALTITDISETSTVHHHNLKTRPHDYGDDVRLLLEVGEIPSAIDYLQAQQLRRRVKFDFINVFKQVDVLVGPTMAFATTKIGDQFAEINGGKVDLLEHMIRLVGPANLAGLPSLSIPCGFVDGLPVGMQIIGPTFREDKVLNVARAFEGTKPLNGRKPNLEVFKK